MASIRIKDKSFTTTIPAEKIQERIDLIARQISQDLEGQKPVFLCVLNGAFLFASDIFKRMNIECEVSFIRVSSYAGTQSTGNIKSIVGISDDLTGRTVVIVEDIVDTGDTIVYLLNELKNHHPSKILLASLLLKPKALKHQVKIDYLGFEVPNDFLVGYGLDYDGLGRNLNDIYKLDQ